MSFNELINVMSSYESHGKDSIKEQLNLIVNDPLIPSEENYSPKSLFEDELCIIEEVQSTIRRSIAVGIFAFWELSLLEIVNTYFKKDIDNYTDVSAINRKHNIKVTDLLNIIFQNKVPKNISSFQESFSALRNFITHGKMSGSRKQKIQNLIREHPDFSIIESNNNFNFSSYSGLIKILTSIGQILQIAENSHKNQK